MKLIEEILSEANIKEAIKRVKANKGVAGVDRVIQQAITQKLTPIYENIFSENSYGFRPNRDWHLAINRALEYLNDGYEWVIDLDIEKYFDTVNHDKLISILRENVNDSHTLHLIRLYLRAGIMDNGLVISSTIGMPQGRTTFANTIEYIFR